MVSSMLLGYQILVFRNCHLRLNIWVSIWYVFGKAVITSDVSRIPIIYNLRIWLSKWLAFCQLFSLQVISAGSVISCSTIQTITNFNVYVSVVSHLLKLLILCSINFIFWILSVNQMTTDIHIVCSVNDTRIISGVFF